MVSWALLGLGLLLCLLRWAAFCLSMGRGGCNVRERSGRRGRGTPTAIGGGALGGKTLGGTGGQRWEWLVGFFAWEFGWMEGVDGLGGWLISLFPAASERASGGGDEWMDGWILGYAGVPFV